MTSVLLPPGLDGLDSIHLSTLRDWSPIVEAGYPWCSVYLGGNYGVKSYAIEAAWAAGVRLMLNYERAPGAAKGGYPAGVQAAQTAIRQAKELGFLGESPLPFSGSDEGFTDSQVPAALEYHRALVDVLGAEGWTGGAYGLRKVMEPLAQQPWWPGDWPIWHWGGDGYNVYWWAWVKQWYGRKPVGLPPPYEERHDISGIPFPIDENTMFKGMRFWTGYGADRDEPLPPFPPSQLGEPVYVLLQYADVDAVFLGLRDAKGQIYEVEWVSPENGLEVNQCRAFGAELLVSPHLMDGGGSSLRFARLKGAMPHGDRFHNWVRSDFRVRDLDQYQGQKGDKGDPGPMPVGDFPIVGGSIRIG